MTCLYNTVNYTNVFPWKRKMALKKLVWVCLYKFTLEGICYKCLQQCLLHCYKVDNKTNPNPAVSSSQNTLLVANIQDTRVSPERQSGSILASANVCSVIWCLKPTMGPPEGGVGAEWTTSSAVARPKPFHAHIFLIAQRWRWRGCDLSHPAPVPLSGSVPSFPLSAEQQPSIGCLSDLYPVHMTIMYWKKAAFSFFF